MADWRQIQARIRKAKNSSDPQAKLTDLYQRTRDAMVAWELGCIEEAAGRRDDAAKWYVTAHGRFRRSDWKKKAEEALTRLGVEVPASTIEHAHPEPVADARAEDTEAEDAQESSEEVTVFAESEEVSVQPAAQAVGQTAQAADGQQRKKRRRGRRGGRGRGRKGAVAGQGLPSTAYADAAKAPPEPRPERAPLTPERKPPESFVERRRLPEKSQPEPFVERRRLPEPSFRPTETSRPAPPVQFAAPQLPSERIAHGRSDPGLTSRMAQLESMLRRLVSSALHRLDEADEAPAGPGVFLLSESDQSTSYYIESCQTLRIGVANLTRSGGGRNSRGGRGQSETSLKSRLADYLGITEAKVAQYMKDHCAIRWIQLDDDAPYLAHFAIGILRTPLNFEE
jgi:hypothetical protein